MWSPAIVIGRELSNDTLEVSFIHRDHVIQTLAANRPNYSFAMCVRHWTSNRSFQYVQTKPTQRFVDLRRENRVTIVDYIAMTGLAVHELAKLLSRPLCGRMICNIDMQNTTRTDLDRDKHVHHLERGRH